MPAALLLAAKSEEEETLSTVARIAALMETIDKRMIDDIRKQSVVERTQEMVAGELSLVLELKGARSGGGKREQRWLSCVE